MGEIAYFERQVRLVEARSDLCHRRFTPHSVNIEKHADKFRDNAVRLQLHALDYNLANLMRTLALPKEVEHWSLATLREKLGKIGAKVVHHCVGI